MGLASVSEAHTSEAAEPPGWGKGNSVVATRVLSELRPLAAGAGGRQQAAHASGGGVH